MSQQPTLDEIFELVRRELERADAKHGPMAEPYEAIGTIKNEVSELDREVVRRDKNRHALKTEAIQVAAMGVKFIRDIVYKEDLKWK